MRVRCVYLNFTFYQLLLLFIVQTQLKEMMIFSCYMQQTNGEHTKRIGFNYAIFGLYYCICGCCSILLERGSGAVTVPMPAYFSV